MSKKRYLIIQIICTLIVILSMLAVANKYITNTIFALILAITLIAFSILRSKLKK